MFGREELRLAIDGGVGEHTRRPELASQLAANASAAKGEVSLPGPRTSLPRPGLLQACEHDPAALQLDLHELGPPGHAKPRSGLGSRPAASASNRGHVMVREREDVDSGKQQPNDCLGGLVGPAPLLLGGREVQRVEGDSRLRQRGPDAPVNDGGQATLRCLGSLDHPTPCAGPGRVQECTEAGLSTVRVGTEAAPGTARSCIGKLVEGVAAVPLHVLPGRPAVFAHDGSEAEQLLAEDTVLVQARPAGSGIPDIRGVILEGESRISEARQARGLHRPSHGPQ